TRQVEELKSALAGVDAALAALRDGLGQDLVSGCLSDAREALSRITGGDRSEDLLHEIFGKFCIGK
ncbi:MAG: tRNA uridine-5-carboxymethylaminomethyl(34) synthesis GTPase MnmE, partial [Pyramidobacter sp.]|nr:tRNA uridine-5-carboxymethylaminomethyl(34) synthesis GTPase MnmE [Pyramidobacter sp.]MBQ8091455.1 tRNA uridine-5-carboxymethylaminomethyl(34) synthesis GTPase MnmE [Pyramidobacter sp.]